jgi:hypothetical protein
VGSFRQHVAVAGVSGVAYAWAAHALAGLHWLYGSMAALLTTAGGLLPDIDHPLGVEVRGLTTLIGTATALVVWRRIRFGGAELAIEAQLWVVILTYTFFRYASRRTLARLTVHRGMNHSLPTCAVWGAATYLAYPSPHHPVRVAMASAVMLGFLSHLVLDEVCSVDLRGRRIKRSFGTALKLWAPSLLATVLVYALLFQLVRSVLTVWPDGPFLATLAEPVPDPKLPQVPADWRNALRWLHLDTLTRPLDFSTPLRPEPTASSLGPLTP